MACPGTGGLRYGLPVWGCKEWVGDLYPAGTPGRKLLEAYGQRLGCVEVNSTHYSVPELTTIRSWAASVPEGFKFYPKFPQLISHHNRLGETGDVRAETVRFVEASRELGSKLGATFLQLPPLFTFADLPLLARYLREFVPRELPTTVELRHPSWFPRGGLAKPAFELFAELGVGTVISETPGRRDVAHASVPGRAVLMRFLGTDGGEADAIRLRAWIPYWANWVELGREIALFLHLPQNENAPRLLERVEADLVAAFGSSVATPALELNPAEPQLGLGI